MVWSMLTERGCCGHWCGRGNVPERVKGDGPWWCMRCANCCCCAGDIISPAGFSVCMAAGAAALPLPELPPLLLALLVEAGETELGGGSLTRRSGGML